MKPLYAPVRGLLPDGRVIMVTPRRQARTLILRRKNNEFRLTVPYGYPADNLADRISELVARFDARFPQQSAQLYYIGQVISCHGVDIELYSQSVSPTQVIIGEGIPRSRLGIGSELSLEDAATEQFVSSVLCRLAYRLAPRLLIPYAVQVAARVGVSPDSWRIGRGLRTLGTCSRSRVITLSCALVFLPLELREYIICHELAHLTEMNHSTRFHALCNSYLQGKEKPLIAALKRHEWPIVR